jgi:hypothetical protein
MSVAEDTLQEYAKDLPGMILDTGWFVTRDEHRHDGEYPFPNHPYQRDYLQELCVNDLVVVTKSRQVMVTWLTLAYILARALTSKHLLAILQTKREDDAIGMADRVKFMYNHLPDFLRRIRPKEGGVRENQSSLELISQDSLVWGVPQGADIIRSHTVSIFYADEVDFQPDAKASLRAAAPSLDGGQGIWTSSACLGGLTGQLIHGSW